MHIGIIGLGMFLVHYPAGWFVVGAGRNGMEYSVLLLAGLIAVAWAWRMVRSTAKVLDASIQTAPAVVPAATVGVCARYTSAVTSASR